MSYAFVLVKFQPLKGKLEVVKQTIKEIQSISGVESVYLVEQRDNPSPYDGIVKINSSSRDSLYKIILNGISKCSNISTTTTMIVIEK